jgi:hypothetical protein
MHVYGADIERLGSSIYRRFDDWPIREAAQPRRRRPRAARAPRALLAPGS